MTIIFIIILCWFVDMPLWLSILGTVFASIDLLAALICYKG